MKGELVFFVHENIVKNGWTHHAERWLFLRQLRVQLPLEIVQQEERLFISINGPFLYFSKTFEKYNFVTVQST